MQFTSADEAWFWCCRHRGSPEAPADYPCAPAEIASAVDRLIERDALSSHQLRLLMVYGHDGDAPHGGPAAAQWERAMRALTRELSALSIVQAPRVVAA